MSRAAIETIAVRVLRQLLPEAWRDNPIDILKVFEHLDDYDERLIPGVEDLGAGVLGQMNPTGEVLLSEPTYRQLERGHARSRFTAAHECGHAVLHFQQITEKLIDGKMRLFRRQEIVPYRDPEWQANAFAAAILMPEQAIRHFLQKEKPSNRSSAIARSFAVSLEAAAIRTRTLHLN